MKSDGAYIGMLKIYREELDKYSSEMIEKPLDHLCDLAGRCASSDSLVGRKLGVAMEMIGEVFSVGEGEVKRMIRDHRKDMPENAPKEVKRRRRTRAASIGVLR
jgi:hypothetical protein